MAAKNDKEITPNSAEKVLKTFAANRGVGQQIPTGISKGCEKGKNAGKSSQHELSVAERRQISRDHGLDEVKVVKEILKLMKSESQTVRVRACELAAKLLGMTAEELGGAQVPGMTIIIKGTEQAIQVNPGSPGAPPRPTSCGQGSGAKALPSPTPLCITK